MLFAEAIASPGATESPNFLHAIEQFFRYQCFMLSWDKFSLIFDVACIEGVPQHGCDAIFFEPIATMGTITMLVKKDSDVPITESTNVVCALWPGEGNPRCSRGFR